MARVYLSTIQAIKDNTTLNDNIDDQLILNGLYEAQEINLQTALGTELYKSILKKVSTGDIILPTNVEYKFLLDEHILPILNYWTWVYSIPYIRFKLNNKSVSGQTSDNSNPSTLEEIQYLKNEIRNKAEFFTQRLIGYLTENKSKFTEYKCNTSYDTIGPSKAQYFSGIEFDTIKKKAFLDSI